MRWERLFADLGAQLEAATSAGFAAEVADRTRRDVATVALHERLRGCAGAPVELQAHGAGRLRGGVRRVGPDWVLLAAPEGVDVLVLTSAIVAAWGLERASSPADPVAARIDVRHVLRGIARDRGEVGITTWDGVVRHGTVDRVGADWLDLTASSAPATGSAGRVTLAIAAVAVVRFQRRD